jgi:putative ABC transport system substrate-binding protein
MTSRRSFLLVGGAAVLGFRRVGVAAQPRRVGILSPGGTPAPDVDTAPNLVPRFLADLGYQEGTNLVVERRFAEGRMADLPRLARDLIGGAVDLIVTAGAEATQAAREATRSVPIVMITSIDPVKAGWVDRLARPGGNVTGVTTVAESVLAAKRLQLLREAVPGIQRVALLSDGGRAAHVQLVEAQAAARDLGLRLVNVPARPPDYGNAFAVMQAERVGAVLVLLSPILTRDHRPIIALAAQHRLPAMFDWRQHAQMGGLMAYGGDLAEISRRVAAQVDRILQGHPPGDVPVEQATTFTLAVNVGTARALGLTLPASVLLRADHVYS